MDSCCEVRPVEHRQRRVLAVVLGINLAMFALEFGAGLLAHSTALLADSVDMLGDAIVYGFSLYVIGRGAPWQARGALLKGVIMAAFAGGIAVEIVMKLARGITPDGDVMSAVACAALAANGAVLWFLWRHRGDDLNMRSSWLCSRIPENRYALRRRSRSTNSTPSTSTSNAAAVSRTSPCRTARRQPSM